MIPGSALAAWLADPDAQERSFAGVMASAGKWGHHPLMTDLERDTAGLAEKSPAAILAAADRFMNRAADFEALLDDLIAGCRADPFFRPPLYPLANELRTGLLLFHNPHLSITLNVLSVDALALKKLSHAGGGSIAFDGQLTKFRYLKAGEAILSFWEAPPLTDDFVAAEAGPARFVERRRIADGEEVLLDGRRQSFVVEHAERDLVYFQAIVREGGAPVTAEYDRDTLAFVSASSTDEAASRVQMMVSLLRTMEREDALPLMEEALASPQFYTRWHVMREMLALDAEAALPSLKRLAESDPHPEVRGAARQTLRLFFEDEPCPA